MRKQTFAHADLTGCGGLYSVWWLHSPRGVVATSLSSNKIAVSANEHSDIIQSFAKIVMSLKQTKLTQSILLLGNTSQPLHIDYSFLLFVCVYWWLRQIKLLDTLKLLQLLLLKKMC